MWKIANTIVKQKQNNVMILEEKGKKIEDELAIAEIFNTHFVTKLNLLAQVFQNPT